MSVISESSYLYGFTIYDFLLECIEQNYVEMSHACSIVEDAINRVLCSNFGHVRGLGFGE